MVQRVYTYDDVLAIVGELGVNHSMFERDMRIGNIEPAFWAIIEDQSILLFGSISLDGYKKMVAERQEVMDKLDARAAEEV